MLRIAHLEDLNSLIDLVIEFKKFDYPSMEISKDNDVKDYLEFVITNNLCTILLLEQNQLLVGYASLVIYPCLTDMELNAYLDELFISKDYQNQGIGSKFLTEIKTWCKQKGVAKLKLVTRPDNLRAQAFYEKNQGIKKDKINYNFGL